MSRIDHARASRAEQLAAWGWLSTTTAIRDRCSMVYAAAERGALEHFELDATALDRTADYVLETIRRNYPALDIPYHSRWRHFAAGGRDRWRELDARLGFPAAERARLRFELAIVSVLTDAGAGAEWGYTDRQSGARFARSEGLAVAGFDMVAGGLLAQDGRTPRVDSENLRQMSKRRLAEAFQVRADNRLAGLEGRAELLRNLGRLIRGRPDVFATREPRLGDFFDHLQELARAGAIDADSVLTELLAVFGPIWPGRLALGGLQLGDVWRHSACVTTSDDLTGGLVPFHKLSQWLAYSLVEPLEEAGITVTDLDSLTGLPEYRNGGLFIDTGVLRLRDARAAERSYRPADELVVEWRALTVILLDRIAELVRHRLGVDASTLPLAKVLEGGTWAAGRRIAAEKRPGGAPPLRIESDGTVF